MTPTLAQWIRALRERNPAPDRPRGVGAKPSARWAQDQFEQGVEHAQRGNLEAAEKCVRNAADAYRLLAAGDRGGYLLELAATVTMLGGLPVKLGADDALATALEAVELALELVAMRGDDFREMLAGALLNLSLDMRHPLQHGEAVRIAEQAVAEFRTLFALDGGRFRRGLAIALGSLTMNYRAVGRLEEAVAAGKESVAHGRELIDRDGPELMHVHNLASALANLGAALQAAQARAEALATMQEACELIDGIADRIPEMAGPMLATNLSVLGICYGEVGRSAEAIHHSRRSADMLEELARRNEAWLPEYAAVLGNLAFQMKDAGRRVDALEIAQDAERHWRHLAEVDRARFLFGLASSIGNVGLCLDTLGRHEEAVEHARQAVALLRDAGANEHAGSLPSLVGMLDNLATCLAGSGRYADALDCAREAHRFCREMVGSDRRSHLPALVRNLGVLSSALREVGGDAEGLPLAEEAIRLTTELVGENRAAFLPLHASILGNLVSGYASVGRAADALMPARKSVAVYRELADDRRDAFLACLATSLDSLGVVCAGAGLGGQAFDASRESLALYRELARTHRAAFQADLASSMRNHSCHQAERGQSDEATALLRECAGLLIEQAPADPIRWASQALEPTRTLSSADDLRAWHVPLLRRLTEYRELAYDQRQVEALLHLRSEGAIRLWQALGRLGAEHGELVDDAVAMLISTLQSPDLARWIEARGSQDGTLDALAELKRQVIDAEQVLGELCKRLPGVGGATVRSTTMRADEYADAPEAAIEAQARRAQALRQQFRDERARLAREDTRFAAAFDAPGPRALRAIAGHAAAGAMLCLLELGSGQERRVVGVLLHADERPTRLLDLPDVLELAVDAGRWQPGAAGTGQRGALRGARPRPSADSAGTSQPTTRRLASRMREAFWTPLREALRASGSPVDRLHLCTHGVTQQLPLALRDDDDCAGLQILAWPGLPYLKLAESTAAAGVGQAAPGPWLVDHDCAWETGEPLPMAAVEAALLRQLLRLRGRAVQSLADHRRADAQPHGQATALVACCHGGAERAQFDHALYLGQDPLTVRSIVQERLGPSLALLPACHAGRTDEDTAGNALGVAAAFMLSGSRVVSASSKAVPDLLQPWLSTLTVWHAMRGLSNREAALLARRQFGELVFPDDYRQWLQDALPHALAAIQPQGADHAISPHARRALDDLARYWPWEGATRHLFNPDASLREQATRSVADGVLRRRRDDDDGQADGLSAIARDMAAFVVVYGTD